MKLDRHTKIQLGPIRLRKPGSPFRQQVGLYPQLVSCVLAVCLKKIIFQIPLCRSPARCSAASGMVGSPASETSRYELAGVVFILWPIPVPKYVSILFL